MKLPRFELLGFHMAAPIIKDHEEGTLKDLRNMQVAFVTRETMKQVGDLIADLTIELTMLRKETSNEKNSNKENACKH